MMIIDNLITRWKTKIKVDNLESIKYVLEDNLESIKYVLDYTSRVKNDISFISFISTIIIGVVSSLIIMYFTEINARYIELLLIGSSTFSFIIFYYFIRNYFNKQVREESLLAIKNIIPNFEEEKRLDFEILLKSLNEASDKNYFGDRIDLIKMMFLSNKKKEIEKIKKIKANILVLSEDLPL